MPDGLNDIQIQQNISTFTEMLSDLEGSKAQKLIQIFSELKESDQLAAIKSYKYFKEKGYSLSVANDEELGVYVESLIGWGINEWTMNYLTTFNEEDTRIIFVEAVYVTATTPEELLEKQSNFQNILDRIGYITPSETPAHFVNADEVTLAKQNNVLQPLYMDGVDGSLNDQKEASYFVRPELVQAMQEFGKKLVENNLVSLLRISSGTRNRQMQDLFFKLGFPAIKGLSFHTQGFALDFPLSRTPHGETGSFNDEFAKLIDEEALVLVNTKLKDGETLSIIKLAEWGIISESHPLMQIIAILKEMEPLGIQFLDETYFNSVNALPVETEGEEKKVYLAEVVRPLLHVQFNPNIINQEI